MRAVEYECDSCYRWAQWTDGLVGAEGDSGDEFWCQTCGTESPLTNLRVRFVGASHP